jgi:hypothetical protein
MSTTNHVLPLPQAFLALRAAQLVVGIVVLGLSAYIVSYIAFNSACLTLFTVCRHFILSDSNHTDRLQALATMIIAVYNIVASTGLKAAYNYWAILGLDIFAIIFWVISFPYEAWTTAAATYWYEYVTSCYGYYCEEKRGLPLVSRDTTDLYTYRNSMAAAAGLGGLEL